jgi:SWIM zinc finger
MTPLVPGIDLIRTRADDAHYTRGVTHHRQGAVKKLCLRPAAADATVVGDRRYRVRITWTGDSLEARCSCPPSAGGAFCQHAVAVALAWSAAVGVTGATGETGRVDAGRQVDPSAVPSPAMKVIRGQVDRIAEISEPLDLDPDLEDEDFDEDEDLDEELELELEFDEDQGDIFKARMMQAILVELLKLGEAANAIEVAQKAIRRWEAGADYGRIGRALKVFQALHLRACEMVRPDPVALAELLTRWAIDSDGKVFVNAINDYEDVYGEAGLQRARKIISDEWAALPPVAAGEIGSSRRRTLHLMRLLAAPTFADMMAIDGTVPRTRAATERGGPVTTDDVRRPRRDV